MIEMNSTSCRLHREATSQTVSRKIAVSRSPNINIEDKITAMMEGGISEYYICSVIIHI